MTARSIVRAAVVALVLASPCSAQTAAELLQKGIYTQDAVRDLDAAIRIYRQVLTPSSPRQYAAQAQGRLVQYLLKKGDGTAAAREFDKLAHDFADFKDVVNAVAAALRGVAPRRIQLRNGPTRILSAIRDIGYRFEPGID